MRKNGAQADLLLLPLWSEATTQKRSRRLRSLAGTRQRSVTWRVPILKPAGDASVASSERSS
jgi:hypothetical protein